MAAPPEPDDGADGAPPVHFFTSPAELRAWLAEHHATATELWVGLYKAGNPEPTLTWSEIVDEALCVGWIDGRGQRIDDRRWKIRLTPRRPGSIWSRVNLDKVAALTADGRMRPAGLAAFEARRAERSEVYSHEQDEVALDPSFEAELRADDAAAAFFFDTSPPSYRKAAIWWVMGAKKDETRRRRLAALIADSARGERVGPLRRR